MNIIDIILLAVALWAIYDGVRDGLLVQIGGVAALVVGAWLAFRYAERVGIWFGMNGAEASVAGFIAVLRWVADCCEVCFAGRGSVSSTRFLVRRYRC